MMVKFCLAVLAFAFTAAGAQPPEQPPPRPLILVVEDKAGLANAISPIYLASNVNGWNPADKAQCLAGRSDLRWQIVLPLVRHDPPMQFKFTRGTWETVEVAADLTDLVNRRLPEIDESGLKPGEPVVLEFVVEAWADQRPEAIAKKAADPYRTVAARGGIRRLEVVGGGTPGRARDLLVWLPPGYDHRASADRRYPVLYMQDGQNLFEQLPGVPGEWRVDETAYDMMATGKAEPCIIVGIPHAGAGRIAEYNPPGGLPGFDARGEAYVQFLLTEVKPRVERSFRVKPGPESTAIGGSSMGALIALYASTRHPDVFGKALLESPTLARGSWQALPSLLDGATTLPRRVYVGMGGKETPDASANERLTASATQLDSLLGSRGVSDRKLVIAPDAAHDEPAWAARFPDALAFLFPADPNAPLPPIAPSKSAPMQAK
ncbi:MAG: alpha/beta hydrolase [Phycisphaerae bacterium]|nr:alpha/beta hydrolase [Phycisphaerae bacterium]